MKVDSKTRKELVEYITKKKLVKTGASDEEVMIINIHTILVLIRFYIKLLSPWLPQVHKQ